VDSTPVFGFIHYYCRTCATGCINPRTYSCARYRECESCHAVPVLDRGDPVDRVHPDLLWTVHAALSDLDLDPRSDARAPPATAAHSLS
jgi:hypothetical protein